MANNRIEQIAGYASSATTRLDVADGNIQKLFDEKDAALKELNVEATPDGKEAATSLKHMVLLQKTILKETNDKLNAELGTGGRITDVHKNFDEHVVVIKSGVTKLESDLKSKMRNTKTPSTFRLKHWPT